MAKKPSNSKRTTAKKNAVNARSRKRSFLRFGEKFGKIKDFFKKRTNWPTKVKLHKSFRRSYREDYKRDIEVPGIMYHAFSTFKMIFKNWKIFLPFLLLIIVLSIVFVGLMNEASYQRFQEVLDETTEQAGYSDIGYFAKAGLLLITTVTTGGLSSDKNEAGTFFMILIFLVIWLTTIFIVRHRLAGHKIKLRDGLYNAMTPLVSTLVVFMVALVQCIPIFFLIVVYSVALQTEFLTAPFYALLFFIFAAIMVLTSGYLLSSSLMALVAVSAPGLYPMKALRVASDLMMGRRVKFILRLVALIFILAITWIVVMLPLIMIDLGFKNFEWASNIPFVPFCLLTMTCFTGIYVTVYLYLYYRWMLKYDED